MLLNQNLMQRVSSNITIFLKFFLPTTWFVFFTTFTISLHTIEPSLLPVLTEPIFKYTFTALYLIFFIIIYFTIFQLKRVELAPDYYVVTDYFKTIRLIYKDIDKVSYIDMGRFSLVTFYLKSKSTFGRKISFIASSYLLTSFLEVNPTVKEMFLTLSSKQKS